MAQLLRTLAALVRGPCSVPRIHKVSTTVYSSSSRAHLYIQANVHTQKIKINFLKNEKDRRW